MSYIGYIPFVTHIACVFKLAEDTIRGMKLALAFALSSCSFLQFRRHVTHTLSFDYGTLHVLHVSFQIA
jgi:hypothetical protein